VDKTEFHVTSEIGAPSLIFLYQNKMYELSHVDPRVPRPARDVLLALMRYAMERLETEDEG
jgi:hypothetical protein